MSDFQADQTVTWIKKLLAEIRQLDQRLRVIEDEQKSTLDPEVPHAGRTSVLSPFKFWAVKVTSVNGVDGTFQARSQIASGGGWADDPVATRNYTVRISQIVPLVDSIVRMEFFGTQDSSLSPRYSVLDTFPRVGVTLTSSLSSGSCPCAVSRYDPATETFVGSMAGVFIDPKGVFVGAANGAEGYGWSVPGNGRVVVLGANLNCGS